MTLASTDMEEPRFGEVWKWSNMGPFMVLGLYSEPPRENRYVDVVILANEENGALARLVWDGGNFRKDWHRIDEGETV